MANSQGQTPTMPPAPPQRKWTEPERRHVMAMLERGATAGMVAREMNLGRSAAMGRIHRDPAMELKKRNVVRPVNLAASSLRCSDASVSDKPAIIGPLSPAGDSGWVQLFETGMRLCKWPVAMDRKAIGGLWCCGAAVASLDVYCPDHRAKSRKLARCPNDH